MNGNQIATDLKLSERFTLKLKNPRWPIVAFLFLFSIYMLHVHTDDICIMYNIVLTFA